MQQSSIQRAVDTLVSTYEGSKGEALAIVIAAAKRATEAKKGAVDSVFAGLLALADTGASAATVRATSAKLRASVATVLRVQAGFPAVKVKGSKETGAPDFSTASVYGALIGDLMDMRQTHGAFWQAAQDKVDAAAAAEVAECGLFANVAACRRHKAAILQLEADAVAAEHPILKDAEGEEIQRVRNLEADNATLRARVATLETTTAPGESLIVARRERDTVRATLLEVSTAAAALRADYDALVASTKRGETLRAERDTARASAASAAATADALRAELDTLRAEHAAQLATLTQRAALAESAAAAA